MTSKLPDTGGVRIPGPTFSTRERIALTGGLAIGVLSVYLVYRFLWAWTGFDNGAYGRRDQRMFASVSVAERKMIPYHTHPILTDGLLIEGFVLSPHSIKNVFTKPSVHFLEVNAATAMELLQGTSNGHTLSRGMRGSAVIRLRMGDDQDPSCLQFTDRARDWTRGPLPVRPGSCLKIEYDNTIRSKLAIRLRDVEYTGMNILWNYFGFDVQPDCKWQLFDRATGSEVIALNCTSIRSINGSFRSDNILDRLLGGLEAIHRI